MSMYDKNISKEKLASLEFAEEQRQAEWTHPSFALQLFHGNPDWSLIHPFPRQSEAEKKEGDELLKKFEDFLRQNLDPNEVDKTGIIPEHVMKGLGELGGFAIKIPKEYGGLGQGQTNYNRIMHLVSSYCGSTAVLMSAHQSIGVPQPLKLFGTDEQKKKYFPMFAKGAVSAFALTEPTAGSDPRQMLTTATPIEDGKFFLINGEKLWCTNGPAADVIVVMAVTPPKIKKGKEIKQITAFIVDTNSPGFEVVQRCRFMGLNGIQNGLLRFKDLKVPRENIILGEGEGLKLALTTLNTGRLTLPAASVGISKWCLYVSREWSSQRKQWGANIGEHESVALKLGYMASHTFAMDAMTWITAAMADDKSKDIRIEAAIAKYFCTFHAWIIVDETLQIRGGQGYETHDSLKSRGMESWPVERVLRDVRINLIIEGTTEIMHLFIAREALDPYLSKVIPLMSPKTNIFKKLGIVFGMGLGYFKLWLPNLTQVDEIDETLTEHMVYVQDVSKRLGREIFHNMTRYQKKLESHQAILNRIVDIGTELFAMATTCSYADMLMKEDKDKEGALELADLFCKAARKRIDAAFDENSNNFDKESIAVSKQVLSGKLKWMETEIMT